MSLRRNRVLQQPDTEVKERMAHPRPVKSVVFDFGRVILDWDPYAAVAHKMTVAQWEQFLVDSNFLELNHLVDAGLPPSELVRRVAETDPQSAQIIDLYFSRFDKALTRLIPGTADTIADLQSAGYPVYGLTNWARETFRHALAAAPVISSLRGVVVSGREGVAKPDPEIYRILFSRYDLDPAETVFIDDSPRNIEGAKKLGMRGILFEDARQVRGELRSMGVNIPA